jgi:hypothetical protein
VMGCGSYYYTLEWVEVHTITHCNGLRFILLHTVMG